MCFKINLFEPGLIAKLNLVHKINMKTERIIFESVSKNDFKDLVNLFTCSQVRKYLGGALDYNLACDKAERLIRRELSEQMWILRDKCQKFIGIIEIGKHHDSDELEISYQLISSAWGKGFMLEAMKMVIQYMFEGQKIVNPYRSSENYFALVDVPWYASADVFFTQTKNSEVLSNEVLTAILNSKVILFWLIHRGKRKGNMLEIKSIPIGQIPIVLPNDGQKMKLSSLVNKIIDTKKADMHADISIFESAINQIVYKLYNLTSEEREIVENN